MHGLRSTLITALVLCAVASFAQIDVPADPPSDGYQLSTNAPLTIKLNNQASSLMRTGTKYQTRLLAAPVVDAFTTDDNSASPKASSAGSATTNSTSWWPTKS